MVEPYATASPGVDAAAAPNHDAISVDAVGGTGGDVPGLAPAVTVPHGEPMSDSDSEGERSDDLLQDDQDLHVSNHDLGDSVGDLVQDGGDIHEDGAGASEHPTALQGGDGFFRDSPNKRRAAGHSVSSSRRRPDKYRSAEFGGRDDFDNPEKSEKLLDHDIREKYLSVLGDIFSEKPLPAQQPGPASHDTAVGQAPSAEQPASHAEAAVNAKPSTAAPAT